MARPRKSPNGGSYYTKHSQIGYGGGVIPANSQIGGACIIMQGAHVGSGTVVDDYVMVRKAVEFGQRIRFGKHARVRGTASDKVVFGPGITFDDGAELRHCYFTRGLRFLGSAVIEHCILPSDTVFSDRSLIEIISCKKLMVDEPYDWASDLTAQRDRSSGR